MTVRSLSPFDRPWAAPILAVALVVAFYGAALNYALVWDDQVWLSDFHLHDVTTLLERNLTGHTLVSYYRPLVSALTTLQLALSESAAFLHALNLVFHGLNLLLFIALVKHVTVVSRPYLLLFAVTVLAIHPMLVEPVVWVSGRFDLCYTTFLLLALLAALAVGSPVTRAICVASCFFVALCCKESALVALWVSPLLLISFAHHQGHRGFRAVGGHALAHFAALVVGLAAYLFVRIGCLQIPLFGDAAFTATAQVEYGQRVLLVLHTLGVYLQMTLLPLWNLEPLHVLSNSTLSTTVYRTLGATIVALALAGWRWPLLLACTVWAGALVPAANFLPLRLDVVQNRYLYFPLFAAGLAALSYPWSRDMPMRRAVCLGVIATLWLASAAVTNLTISRLWRDGVSLFSWAVAANPNSQFAMENLALALYAAGDYPQAIITERRIAERARSFQGRVLLARALRGQGDTRGAAAAFEQALAKEITDPALQVSASYELAIVHAQLGHHADSARLTAAAEVLAKRYQVSSRMRDYYRAQLGVRE